MSPEPDVTRTVAHRWTSGGRSAIATPDCVDGEGKLALRVGAQVFLYEMATKLTEDHAWSWCHLLHFVCP